MRAESVSFPHAVELLRDGVAPTPIGRRRAAVRSTVSKLPSRLPIGADQRELLERVVGFYAQTLRGCPEALAVLERRGLGEQGLIEEFRLGYANRTLGYRLPAKNRKPGAELRQLQELGVFRATIRSMRQTRPGSGTGLTWASRLLGSGAPEGLVLIVYSASPMQGSCWDRDS